MNDLPPVLADSDTAHEAYNAAFYELGLRWHWDADTYAALVRHSADPHQRVRHYMETQQPHLLAAYDPAFLAAAIHERRVGVLCCLCLWSVFFFFLSLLLF